MCKVCYFEMSNEESKAFEIWQAISRYSNKSQGFISLGFPIEFLNDLHFEILNKREMTGKNHLISISLSLQIDFSLLAHHLMTFGIVKQFQDKTVKEKEERKYLTVWV